MATLTVWACPGAEDADRAVDQLTRLRSEMLITLQDAELSVSVCTALRDRDRSDLGRSPHA